MNSAEFAASVNEEALEKMQYLHAALTETLRIYSAVPVVIELLPLERSQYVYMNVILSSL